MIKQLERTLLNTAVATCSNLSSRNGVYLCNFVAELQFCLFLIGHNTRRQ